MLSNTCKYAIRALIYLAKHSGPNQKIGIKQITEEISVPAPFLSKILQNLARHDILASVKGPHGGFSLGRKPEDISLYDIIIDVDGESYFCSCIVRLDTCKCFDDEVPCCPMHKRFGSQRTELINFYKSTTLADIILDFDESGEDIKF
ncbi:MAG: Rrf2 family transcriptional regulator [Prolixibacteraceae bacterium]|nr:Rrf2 family transcriptional regulator [Prolixibacteraceae bacterium]